MQKKYDAMQANILPGNMEASSVMQKTPVETLKSILNRIGLAFEEGLPKETYVSAFKEEFCNNTEWILKMIPGELLNFLVQIWENQQIKITPEQWEYLQYLKIFGLLTFKKGNPLTDEPNEIYCIQEMKDTFYFLLKSKKSKKLMEQYEESERIITGFMYYYGMVEMTVLHEYFMRVTKRMISYQEFVLFVKCRCSLWSFGLILRDNQRKREYYQYVNVENAETLLMYIREHKDLSYKNIEKEDLFYISDAAGIDNRWKGVSELGTLFLEEMKMDYYRATVMIKMLIIMIQNSCQWKELYEKITVLSFADEKIANKVYDAAKMLYENVPVFEYKGFSRKEFEGMSRQNQLKKRKEMFKIIRGNKHDI